MASTATGLESLVWLDFQVAVLTTVILPLLLTVWAFGVRMTPLVQLLTIYWRVSSLLMISVYLMIGGLSISFLTGPAARALLPFCLWFWQELSQAIESESQLWVNQSFLIWRWVLTGYMTLGFFFSLAFLPCAAQQTLPPICQVWFQPPLAFKQIFHPDLSRETLGLAGIIGLFLYILYGLYFLWQQRGRTKSLV